LKLLELKSFDVCKNAAAPMIVMLSHSELDMKVSDADTETMESNNCRGMSRKDRDINGMLTMIQKEVRFFYKDGWKSINPFIQLISELCQVSQLYPRTKEQEESSGVI